jgi:hypothetical protein
MKVRSLLAALTLCGLGAVGTAHASFIGSTATCSDTQFGACSPASAVVVDPGIEFTQYAGLLDIDVLGSAVELSNSLASTLLLSQAGTLTIGNLHWTGTPQTIVGLVITSMTGVTGLTASDLSFGANSVSVNLQGTAFAGPSGFALLTIQTRNAAVVPEPATLALLGLGLAGLGLARRKQ